MKTVVVLCVLVLALIGGAAAGKKSEEIKDVQEDTCKNLCLDKKVKGPACKEACALNERFKRVWIVALQCSLKCNKKHGIGAPATKPCEGECKKKYEDKVAEIADSCADVCSKEEKDPLGVEKCKKICSPSLIYKEMQEKAAQDKAAQEKAVP